MNPFRAAAPRSPLPFPKAPLSRVLWYVLTGRFRALQHRRWRALALSQARADYAAALTRYERQLAVWLAGQDKHRYPPPQPLPQFLPWDPNWATREFGERRWYPYLSETRGDA